MPRRNTEGGLTQPAVDEIAAYCLKHKLAVKKNIMVRNCGIHAGNRARTRVDPSSAQNLALKISGMGYSESKLEGFEAPAESAPGTMPAASECIG